MNLYVTYFQIVHQTQTIIECNTWVDQRKY